MTRKECCEADPKGEKFYSEDESTLGSFDLRFIMATHKCGMACDGNYHLMLLFISSLSIIDSVTAVPPMLSYDVKSSAFVLLHM